MSDDLAEIRKHLARHDGEIAELTTAIATEASLRAMMDQDQASLKTQLAVHGKLLQTVATTQGEHSRQLTHLETDVAELKRDVAELKTDMAEVKVGVRLIADHLLRIDDN